MNLTDLYEMQKPLDERIRKERGLEGENLLPRKVLSLNVELGELAQEIGDLWKYWKTVTDRKRERELEEYVDCLHFALSIAIEAGYTADDLYGYDLPLEGTPVDQMNELFMALSNFKFQRKPENKKQWFRIFMHIFWNFGEQQLGFDFDEIAAAYAAKNATNHPRQQTGY